MLKSIGAILKIRQYVENSSFVTVIKRRRPYSVAISTLPLPTRNIMTVINQRFLCVQKEDRVGESVSESYISDFCLKNQAKNFCIHATIKPSYAVMENSSLVIAAIPDFGATAGPFFRDYVFCLCIRFSGKTNEQIYSKQVKVSSFL